MQSQLYNHQGSLSIYVVCLLIQIICILQKDKVNCWILPIIQGYVQIEKCVVEVGFDEQPQQEIFNLAIISRRSRFRAGTR